MSELKEFLDKTYVLDRSENYEEFLFQLCVTRHTRMLALNSKPIVTLSQEKDQYILTMKFLEGRIVKIKFKPEEKIQRRPLAGSPTTSVFHIDKNRIIEELSILDKTILIEREFMRRELVVKMTVDNVECCRFYKMADLSKLSFETETSRRSSLWKQQKEIEIVKPVGASELVEKIKIGDESEEENLCF